MELYERIGTQIHEVSETPGISTTYLISKIRGTDREQFRRNLGTRPRVGLGQDTHKFAPGLKGTKPLILGGVIFEGENPMEANSDGDVVLHAVTRALSGVTGVQVIGPKTKQYLKDGITDSKVYLREAMKDLTGRVTHLSISIECKAPKITPRIPEMQASLAALLETKAEEIGITATSGEEMNEAGKGHCINVLAVVTVE